MSRSICYVATTDDCGVRLDTLLSRIGAYESRSAAAHAIEAGLVQVKGNTVPKKYNVCAQDAIVYTELEPKKVFDLMPEDIDLDIRFEDEYLLVLSKQAGLVCHPTPGHASGTLVNALLYHCGEEHLCNVQGQDDRPGIVHRLDCDTSGLMLAAKTDEVGYALMDSIAARSVDRHYIALVHGIIAPDTGMIDAPIARAADMRTRMTVRDCPSARDAITTFRVLERFGHATHDDGYTLIECKLFTGRTHQIRVHMQYTRHPVVGDQMYTTHAPHSPLASLGLSRQFLHSWQLSFDHPITNEHLSFNDGLPPDLSKVLDSLSKRSKGRTEAGNEIYSLIEKVNRENAEKGGE